MKNIDQDIEKFVDRSRKYPSIFPTEGTPSQPPSSMTEEFSDLIKAYPGSNWTEEGNTLSVAIKYESISEEEDESFKDYELYFDLYLHRQISYFDLYLSREEFWLYFVELRRSEDEESTEFCCNQALAVTPLLEKSKITKQFLPRWAAQEIAAFILNLEKDD